MYLWSTYLSGLCFCYWHIEIVMAGLLPPYLPMGARVKPGGGRANNSTPDPSFYEPRKTTKVHRCDVDSATESIEVPRFTDGLYILNFTIHEIRKPGE